MYIENERKEAIMEKFIPFEKLSKKKQREHNAQYRNDWGDVKPTSRVVESAKLYKRRPKHRKENYEST